ncbi:MAG: threonine synthase [Actinobacteria bacterium]|nr:MAG: threonine synthase [Actinomycetota bacterium]
MGIKIEKKKIKEKKVRISHKKMDRIKGLACKECKREYPAEAKHVCEFCFGPLEVNYNYDAIKLTKEKIKNGPLSIWRYKELLPVETEDLVDLQAGFTPLIEAKNLAKILGLKKLWLKNDTVNPTFSFKDRVVSVALSKAREFGYKTVACASTGNLANSVAAHAANAGLEAFIFIPYDLERGKIINSAVYEPNLVGVKGSYDDVNRLCSEIASEYDWAFVNINIRPYYSEGSKTLGYETVEQLGWRTPDHVIIPVASGSMLTKIYKAFEEFKSLGLIKDNKVKISGAQAEGCSPIAAAFKSEKNIIKPVKPKTLAKSLAIGNPADGYYALKTVQKTGGFFEEVTDAEIVNGIKLLASSEGIFAETAGGVTIAVLKKLVDEGKIKPEEEIVAYITGIGLKTLEAVEGSVELPRIIDSTLKSFKQNVLKEVK